jgi:hypothetical protein
MVFENVELIQLLTNLIHDTKQIRVLSLVFELLHFFNHQIICLSNLELKAKKILGELSFKRKKEIIGLYLYFGRGSNPSLPPTIICLKN